MPAQWQPETTRQVNAFLAPKYGVEGADMCPEEDNTAASTASLKNAPSNHAHIARDGAEPVLILRAMSLSQAQGRRAAQKREAQQAQPQPGALAQQEQGASAQQAPLELAGADQPGGSNTTALSNMCAIASNVLVHYSSYRLIVSLRACEIYLADV